MVRLPHQQVFRPRHQCPAPRMPLSAGARAAGPLPGTRNDMLATRGSR
ncbi:hypothetical protein A176_002859 [Myxococcus hansupus]|uniref:Uncharacterized protein n=1 Tax=Pseudomyxococcus hansupus TaxID=1297742 RepID=A0A0H4XD49_9BACT|nr:hypothetical protein A176_002859 [Myxococcus hansupus]